MNTNITINNIGKLCEQYGLLDAREERDLLERLNNEKCSDDARAAARQDLIYSNLRLVMNIAHTRYNRTAASGYNKASLCLEDFILAGIEGLIVAIDRFKLTHKTRLSTYATQWIKLKIRKETYDNDKILRIPEHVIADASKYIDLKAINPEASDEAIRARMNVTEEAFKNAVRALSPIVSLDQPVFDSDSDGNRSLCDTIPDGSLITPIGAMEKTDVAYLVRDVLADLDPLDRELVVARYMGGKNTLADLGSERGISGERVRQRAEKALETMKSNLKKRGITCPQDVMS